MKDLRARRLLAVLVVGALALTACGGGESSDTAAQDSDPASAATSDAPEASAPETTDITFATFSTGIPSLPALVAHDAGYFEEEGLNVTVEKLESTSAVIPVLASGSAQIGYQGYSSAIDAKGAGVELVAITGSNQLVEKGQQLYVRDDSDIQSIADLRDRSIGVLAVGSFGDVLIGEALAAEGMTLDDVNLQEVGFPNMAAAIEAGDVDAGWLPSPFNAAVLTNPDSPLRLLVDFQDVESLTDLPIGGLFTTADFAEQNPGTIAAFERAVEKAGKDLEDEQFNREKQAEYGSFTPEVAAAAPVFVYPGGISVEELERYKELQGKHGKISDVDVDEMVLAS